jgi:rRNA-processing protein FCF1
MFEAAEGQDAGRTGGAGIEDIVDAPVPILKKRSENRVVRELKKVAIKGCGAQLQALSDCSQDRLFSVAWACRRQNAAVNACLAVFSEDDELRDELRRKYVGYLLSTNDAACTGERTEPQYCF